MTYRHLTGIREDNTGIVRITWHWGVFLQPYWLWKSNEYYIFWECVCSLRYL